MSSFNNFENYAAFDFEWKKTGELYCAAFVDDMGNEDVYHLDDFPDEEELLEKINKKIMKYPLTIGYYTTGEGSDFDVLHQRCQKYHLSSIVNPRKIQRMLPEPVHGRTHIDLFMIFDKGVVRNYIFKKRYKDQKLQSVAKALLGEGKTEGITGSTAESMTVEKQKEYCLNDARLTFKLAQVGDIDKKTKMPKRDYGLMKLMYALADKTGLPIQTICNFGMSSIWRKILRDMKMPETPIEFRPEMPNDAAHGKRKKRQGPIVLEPVVGDYRNVVVLDVASLYPSIIIKHNISPDAMCCECCRDLESSKVPNKPLLWSCKQKKGAVTTKFTEMREERMVHKRNGNKVMADGLKIVMNAKTGLFNNPYYEYSDVRCYDSIIAFERHYIMQIIEIAKTHGCTVIYGDTDSIMFPNSDAETARKIIEDVKAKLGLELEHDKTYARFMITGKKHYIGVKEDGDIVVAGIEAEKNDRPKWINEAFAQFTRDYANGLDPSTLLQATYDEFRAGNVSLNQLFYSTKLTRNWEDYESENQNKKLGQMANASAGDVVYYWKTHNGVAIKVNSFNDLDKKEYEKTFESAFGDILQLLGKDIRAITRGQLTLNFWS